MADIIDDVEIEIECESELDGVQGLMEKLGR